MPVKINIPYLSEDHLQFHAVKHTLDVFHPGASASPAEVLIFIHGGTWLSGSKDMYSQLGRNMAAKGLVCAIINYRLGDLIDFSGMANDCAAAIQWVYANVDKFGGNKKKIFIAGHSAGGHLAALVASDPEYFDRLNMGNPIKGCILIDAFGLNIGTFIERHGAMYLHYIEKVFSRNPATWKKASPVSFLSYSRIPYLMLVGSRSYPFLIEDNEAFVQQLKQLQVKVKYEIVSGKSHQEMVTQFQDENCPVYKILTKWLKEA